MKIEKANRTKGLATVELMAAVLFIGVPCLLALAQLARLDHAARRLHYGAQAECLKAAMAGDADPDFRILSVSLRTRCPALPGPASRWMGTHYRVLKRDYAIATGSGHGQD